jgi:hypothetical protein
MKNSKKHGIKSLIIVLIIVIFTGSFLLLELGIPLKTSVYADLVESNLNSTQTYSEFLHNLTLRNAKSSQVSPSITVLNHGYMGGPGAWNMDDNFDANSLSERLRTTLNADIYVMGVLGEKGNDSRVYVQHPIGYIDEKYDAGNDRYTDGNGNGIKAQEIGLTNKN